MLRGNFRDSSVLRVQRLLSQWKGKVASEYELAKGRLRDHLSLGCTAGEVTVGAEGHIGSDANLTFDTAPNTP